jgi:DNA processing protein
MPEERDLLAAWLRLTLVPGLGGQGIRKLLSTFGLPTQILAAPRTALANVVGESLATRLHSAPPAAEVRAALDWAAQPGNAIVTLADTEYPRGLLEIPDPPAVLYVRGRTELLAANGIAIVGSRNATAQGLANAEMLARALSRAGLTIASGLALGIDAAAHRGALDGPGATVGVLGTGIDLAYPARNADLFALLATRGAIVSEFPLGTPPIAANFPRRNRLISGLVRGVVVVEAALDSGSLITARLAGEQGREVFAVPGSIHSPLSKGCHALIKQGAKLVESAADVLAELHGSVASSTPSRAPPEESHVLLRHVGYDPCNVDTLCNRSGLTAESVSAMLLQLELEGKIASLPGGRFQRVPERDQT